MVVVVVGRVVVTEGVVMAADELGVDTATTEDGFMVALATNAVTGTVAMMDATAVAVATVVASMEGLREAGSRVCDAVAAVIDGVADCVATVGRAVTDASNAGFFLPIARAATGKPTNTIKVPYR